MKENIKLFAKITGRSFLKWLLVAVSGSFLSLLFLVVILFQNWNSKFYTPFSAGNIPGWLLLFGAPAFVFLYVVAANKIATETVIYGIWKNKAEAYIQPQVANILEKVVGSNDQFGRFTNASMLRLQLLDTNRNSRSPKIQVRVVNYIFRKIRLDDIDFKQENIKLSGVLSQKFSNFISDVAQPSYRFFWIVLVVQVVLFICAQIFGG